MKKIGIVVLFLLLVSGALLATHDFTYIHPKPGSDFHNPQTTIILKMLDTPNDVAVTARGRSGGEYSGSLSVRDHTVLFHPYREFVYGDTIDVLIKSDNLSFDYFFIIKNVDDVLPSASNSSAEHVTIPASLSKTNAVRMINGVAVPSDFPVINTTLYGETAPGRIFFASTFFDTNSRSNYIVICENDGTPYFYRKYDRANLGSGEFKVQPNGLLSFYRYLNSDEGFYVIMDHNFVEVDTFRAGHGYRTDSHEMLLLDNGHALLVCEEDRRMDLSYFGGQSNAHVIGNHIQEVDSDGIVYWEWRCWDYLKVEDAIEVNRTGGSIDMAHTNSIAIDFDGNYVVSHRSQGEVNKINSVTGEFIWRFGGNNNQFDSDDNYRFSAQHHFSPVPGQPNFYTLYDNGNNRSPSFTRAVEYKIDPEKKTAERIWQYRYDKVNFASMMGSVQRLANNKTYIDWSAWPPLRACEVDENNNLLFEIEVQGISSYRSRRYDWDGIMLKPYLLAETSSLGVTLIFNKFGDNDVKQYLIYGGTSENNMAQLLATTQTFVELSDLENNKRHYFKVCAVNSTGEQSEYSETVSALVSVSRPGDDMIVNGDFSDGDDGWRFNLQNGASANGFVQDGEYHVEIDAGQAGSGYSDIQVIQESFPMIQGRQYVFEFDAWADGNRAFEPRVAENGGDWTVYSKTTPMAITRQKKRFRFEFEMTDPTDSQARVVLNCGTSDFDCYFDNVSVRELLPNYVQDQFNSPSSFALQNYPNPFNPSTTISYSLPRDQFVTLAVYDVRGREIQRLVHERITAGQHLVLFDGSDSPSGVFLYKLQTESHTIIRKMILVK